MAAGVEERIQKMLREDLKPVRPLPADWQGVAGALVLALGMGGMLALLKGTHGWEGLSLVQAGSLLLVWGVGIVLGVISLMESLRPGSRERVPGWVAIGILSGGFLVTLWALFPLAPGADLLVSGRRCLLGGLALVGVSGMATYVFVKRGYSLDWRRTGALSGSLAGVMAAAALQVSCPDNEFVHLAASHWMVVLLAIYGGYLAGSRQRV